MGMAVRFRNKRILYTLLFVGFIYLTVQFVSTQVTLWHLNNKDIKTLLNEVNDRLQTNWQHESPEPQLTGQQACRHPNLEVQNPDFTKFVETVPSIDCGEKMDWVHVNGSTMYITDEARAKHGDIQCSFTDVVRANDYEHPDGVTTHTSTKYTLEKSDFVKVRCKSSQGDTWHSLLAGIRHDQELVYRASWDRVSGDSLRLNVLILGFDSVARNMFVRRLPRTYRYLMNSLQAIDLQGYNIVGDGTTQALIPILTGKTELELPETRKRMGDKASYVNVYPFVWNKFRDNGYVTAFMEDSPNIGTFTYRLKGFDSPPTDHYMRPFHVTAQSEYSSYKYCIGAVPSHKVMMNYVHDFFKVYKDKPKFLFSFLNELSHDSASLIQAADLDLLEWLRALREEGHLNNTLLIMMSDHGQRFMDVRNTQQGKQEERLPMFSLVFPPWFQRLHPELMHNLKINSHRLTSPFDIYTTLHNILHFQGAGKGDIKNRSISLFKEVPMERTCMDAYIEPHWCACLDWLEVSLYDSVVKRAAEALVDFINKYTNEQRHLCASLKLDDIQWAAKLIPTKGLLQFQRSADLDGFAPVMSEDVNVSQETYQLKITTQPGNGMFEASLRYDLIDTSFTIRISDVSRINKYGSAAHCVQHTEEQLRKYCYCKTPPPKK